MMSPVPPDPLTQLLASREAFRDKYLQSKDPIPDDRTLWRAQTFRHLVHLFPGQTVLEIGCGAGIFTRQLVRVSRGENPITALSFQSEVKIPQDFPAGVEFVRVANLQDTLKDRTFDFIVAVDMLDGQSAGQLLQQVSQWLKPGGQVLFWESNPWNIYLKLRRFFSRRDPRQLLSRPQLYELISELGFIRVFAVFNDFVYTPLAKYLGWAMRNVSILLENAPVLQTFSGSILVHAQKPPRINPKPTTSLFEHESLRGKVSVVIPCHNEEMNITPLVEGLKACYGDYLREIIPVDDNSRDGTREVLKRLASADPLVRPVYRTPPNGVGRALKDGYRAATGDYVLSMDCDFQHLLPELRDIFDAAAEGYDLVTGSRFSRNSVLLNYPFMKIAANRGFHFLAHFLLFRRFRDLTNNLKMIRRDVLNQLNLIQDGFAINAETGLQPLAMGCAIKEVPISWINRTPDMGISSFKLMKVGGGYWRVLGQLFLRNFGLGDYKNLKALGKNRRTTRARS